MIFDPRSKICISIESFLNIWKPNLSIFIDLKSESGSSSSQVNLVVKHKIRHSTIFRPDGKIKDNLTLEAMVKFMSRRIRLSRMVFGR